MNRSLSSQRNKHRNSLEMAEGISSDPLINYDTLVQEPLGQMGYYSVVVLLIIELGMVSVCGGMLSTTYHNIPPQWTCNYSDTLKNSMNLNDIILTDPIDFLSKTDMNNSCSCPHQNRTYFDKDGFESLSRTFGLICNEKLLSFRLATYTMTGAFFGSILFGQLADKFGRKSVGAVTLAGNVLSSIAMYFANASSYTTVCFILATLGMFGAGYLVVGNATTMEFAGRDYRLFVICMNGWQLGLMYMGITGFLTRNWRAYHLVMGLSALPFLGGWLFLVESPRWLIRMHRLEEAERAIQKIARFNRVLSKASDLATLEYLYKIDSERRTKLKSFTYLTLLGYPKLLLTMSFLCFMWFSTGAISWGIYLNVATFFGNIYMNIFFSGLSKGVAGFFIPLGLNVCLGRRQILIVGVSKAVIFLWVTVACFIYLQFTTSTIAQSVIAVSAVLVIAAFDIVWKINHLYANELFPTVIRSISNGLANGAAGLAAIVSPQIMTLGIYYPPAPYILFCILGILHLVVAKMCMPETKGIPLQDSLPPKSNEHRKKGVQGYGSIDETDSDSAFELI